MRIVSVSALEPNGIIGKTVYDEKGLPLLREGAEITPGFIMRLRQKNIPAVYVKDHLGEAVEYSDVIDHEVRVKAVQSIKGIFDKIEKQRETAVKRVRQEDYEEVRSLFDLIYESIENNKGATFNVAELMSSDLYTYNHSLNVAILSILTAKTMGESRERLKELGVGAILHDIGKVSIPDSILNKPSKLTDEERRIVETHPEKGYEMVQGNSGISAFTKAIILQHHERSDGSGYPEGIRGGSMHPFVKVVSLCDVFDATTSDRCYRMQMPAYRALELVSSQVHTGFENEIFQAFAQNVSIYPLGSCVQLSDGREAIVVRNNPEHPARPVVRLLNPTANPEMNEINLIKNLTVFIEKEIEAS